MSDWWAVSVIVVTLAGVAMTFRPVVRELVGVLREARLLLEERHRGVTDPKRPVLERPILDWLEESVIEDEREKGHVLWAWRVVARLEEVSPAEYDEALSILSEWDAPIPQSPEVRIP